MPAPDLSKLPRPLKTAAILTSSSEEMWPREMAADVVEALAERGQLVLGLDLRSDGEGPLRDDDVATEIPWHSYRTPERQPGSVEEARRCALEALSRPELHQMPQYRWILVTWDEPSSYPDQKRGDTSRTS